tara:strand:- start:70 stop:276 length:207 start_codon:yes stop_codon:yes gene_type:complete
MSKEYNIEDLVVAIGNREPVEVEKAFSSVLSSKLQIALDNKKQELAKSVFTPELGSAVVSGEESTDGD